MITPAAACVNRLTQASQVVTVAAVGGSSPAGLVAAGQALSWPEGYGDPSWLHIEKEDLNIYAMPLPDGYFVVLVQRGPAVVATAKRSLAHACEQLTRELFISP